MKILITTDLFRPAINGVVTSVLNLERELEKNGHEVKILAVSDTCSTYQMENVYYIRSVPAKILSGCANSGIAGQGICAGDYRVESRCHSQSV